MKRRGMFGFLVLLALVGLFRPDAMFAQARLDDGSSGGQFNSAVRQYLASYASPDVRGPAPVGDVLRSTGSVLSIPADSLTAVVKQYCVVCHNDVLLTGNLTLSDFDVASAPGMAVRAEKMIVKLRAGMMPIPGAPRPSPDTLLALVETLEQLIDEAAA